MNSQNELLTAPSANDLTLTLTRTFHAPRPLVWQAWTQSAHLQQWCAPHGFAVTLCEGEVVPGGAWRSAMRSPEGEEFRVSGIYREVVENEKLVFTHVWDEADRPAHETLVTVTFEDEGDQTRMTFQQENFRSPESRDGHEGGWSESFERLATHLAEVQSG